MVAPFRERPVIDDGDVTCTAAADSSSDVPRAVRDHHPVAPLQYRNPDRYEVIGEHGRGGIGRVQRAHDKELGRSVAIKELIKRGDVGEVRFLREAMITARLEHPGIVPIHEAGRWPDGTPFYVMKLVAGRSLKELIDECRTVDERLELLHHVIAVADAVAYAHERGIIHRDLKPANVIAGDFGETVVIDWGLAKDLRAAHDEPLTDGPFRTPAAADLTAVGSVVGTPLYMSPEQACGETVDERTDVYAIGAMLWELCSLRRVAPSSVDNRERLLRRAGIDKDLVTIVNKALAEDVSDRYENAGRLAGDLKAFKSGARITARRYSLPAVLAHWFRRNRPLALTVAGALVLGVVGAVSYVTNIASERDRADAALVVSKQEQQRATQANNELVLQNAELLLQRDPTAAAAAVASYRGLDDDRRRRIAAEAYGRGVARSVLTPHSDTIWFASAAADGTIISLGEDRTVRVTHAGKTTTIANDVSPFVTYDDAPEIQRIAYPTSPSGISILDLQTRAITRIDAPMPVALALAPDGTHVAALDARGKLTIRTVAPARIVFEQSFPDALRIMFADPTHLVVREKSGIRTITIGAAFSSITAPIATTTFEARHSDIAVGDASGHVTLFSVALERNATIAVCRDRVNNVRIALHARVVAFACQDGKAGVVRYEDPRNVTVESFTTNRANVTAEPDPTGERIVVATVSTDVHVFDAVTRISHRYDGQPGRVSFVTAPSATGNEIVVGDVNGGIRVYELAPRDARTVVRVPGVSYGVAFSPDATTIVTEGSDPAIHRINLADGATTELAGHTGPVLRVRFSPDGTSFSSFSHDGSIRVWPREGREPLRTFTQHAGTIGDADYTEGGRRIVSAGDDGRLLAWSPSGTAVSVLFTHTAPLVALEVLARNHHVVVHDTAGSVWDVSGDGKARKVRDGDGVDITLLRASLDGKLVAVGTRAGDVIVYETDNYSVVHKTALPDAVRQIYFDPRGRDLLASSEAGRVRLLPLNEQRAIAWRDLAIGARDVAYGADGDTIALVCSDGSSWFYRVQDNAWVHVRDHASAIMSGRFSRTGDLFATTDTSGSVVIRDVKQTFARKLEKP